MIQVKPLDSSQSIAPTLWSNYITEEETPPCLGLASFHPARGRGDWSEKTGPMESALPVHALRTNTIVYVGFVHTVIQRSRRALDKLSPSVMNRQSVCVCVYRCAGLHR